MFGCMRAEGAIDGGIPGILGEGVFKFCPLIVPDGNALVVQLCTIVKTFYTKRYYYDSTYVVDHNCSSRIQTCLPSFALRVGASVNGRAT